ncbi:hypothetical protein HXX76_014167 [Chlamydomonas incerta]|uniref:Minor capsid protein P8 central region domain-containing protein n=1 Tax=Chlamydomonas incerta TaxID=51695 RepID=A0A835VTJ6_CHLIN|nr:hypothetical protein HXX76_014167 [Chlamydomonas incerta]|eukprot:KAG2425009.1 hypothetical protein HXX76_014167 [Chlamydomonas incerta]
MRLIASVTTTPPRAAEIGPAIASILKQSCPPDAVVIGIPQAYRRFPGRDAGEVEASIPTWIRAHPAVQVLRIDEDYGPATKLVAGLQAADGDPRQAQDTTVVVTFDDDITYLPGMLETLTQRARTHPGCALGYRGFSLEITDPGGDLPGVAPGVVLPTKTMQDVQILEGFSMVLYPRRCPCATSKKPRTRTRAKKPEPASQAATAEPAAQAPVPALTFQDLKPGKALVIDRCKNSSDNISALVAILKEKGYQVHIRGGDGGVTAGTATGAQAATGGCVAGSAKNILAMFLQRPSCTLVLVTGGGKASSSALPQHGSFTVYYLTTGLQRLPFNRGQFSQVITLEDDEEQQYSRLAKAFVAGSGEGSLQLHDLNMLLLVLHHNLMHCKHLKTAEIVEALTFMAAMEPLEDQYAASLLQCQHLAKLYRRGPPLEHFEFTQHLSRFSHVMAAHRRARAGGWDALRALRATDADASACAAVRAALTKRVRPKKGVGASAAAAAAAAHDTTTGQGGQMCATPVSNAFFSGTNLDALQGEIGRRVREYCGKQVTRQADTEVLAVMRSVYLQYSLNASETDVLPEVRMLNEKVLEYCVPNIISNLVQYDRYLAERDPANTGTDNRHTKMATCSASAQATQPSVSTITLTASIADQINIQLFMERCRVSSPALVRVECYGPDKQLCTRGTPAASRARRTVKCGFDNQVTAIVVPNADAPSHQVNVKVFKNGTVQMTGAKDMRDGCQAAAVIMEELRRLCQEEGLLQVVGDPQSLQVSRMTVQLINSNFRVPFKINNQKLLGVLLDNYKHVCIYEPCIYPGAKLLYYWNSEAETKDGICRCPTPCLGKGRGCGVGQCKKVTVPVFQSGSVMITGASSFEQLEEVYKFTVALLTKHRGEIEHQETALTGPAAPRIDLCRLELRPPTVTQRADPQPNIFKYFCIQEKNLRQCELAPSMADAREGDLVNVTYYDEEKNRLTKGDTSGMKKRRVKPRQAASTEKRKGRTKGHFGNQISVLVALPAPRCYANVKVFKNGTIQMTGAKVEEHAALAVRAVAAELRRLGPEVAAGVAEAPEETLSTEMMNSNFRVSFKINNRLLMGVLLAAHGHMCIYEPCIYPGIKIKYYWSASPQTEPGVCQCPSPCWASKQTRAQRRAAAAAGQPPRCKKLTAVVFQTGSIAIFGAQSAQQRDEVYTFLVGVLHDNRAAIEHSDAVTPPKIELTSLLRLGKASGKAVMQQYGGYSSGLLQKAVAVF